ncbi:MAG: ribosome assembly factor SBDS [Haloquadratum sp.]|jgi:ribosome maturation protein SDO1|nr:ribosome assembly factor SBDS [Haloferacaceae archaeon]MDR9444767.1 ribosome assembly factor SBDS [Haloquadratum sp.]
MIPVDEAVVARLESHGQQFEVLVEPDAALAIRRSEFDEELEDVIAAEDVFEDATRGDRPPETALEEVFGTTEPLAVIEEIITRGEIQITAEQRKQMAAQKHRQLVDVIARNAINPQMDDAPHPPDRIERALEQTDFRIDPMRPVEQQVDEALDALRPVIPIRFDEVTVAVRIPAEHAGAAQARVREYAGLDTEEWQADGAWVGVTTFPAGLQTEFYELVNEWTQGTAETKIIKDRDELSTR